MVKSDEILSFLEETISVEHMEKVSENYKKSLNYDCNGKTPVRINFPLGKFKAYPYSEGFYDMEKMLTNELISVCNAVLLKDDTIPMIRAHYGVGILPSLFGVGSRLVNNDMPWVDHVNSTDDIRRIVDKGIPDLNSGLGKRIFQTHEYYAEKLSKYPKCEEYIPVYHPDLQGPFDVAHLIWGPDIYYALYDEPELVHKFLELITDTYIVFLKKLKETIKDTYNGFVYHWGSMFKGGVVLRDDSAVNLSKPFYEEFVKPYDERILKAFGGGSIHYCGRAEQWIFSMMESPGLGSLNFGQPPKMLFEFDFLNKIYDKAKLRNISIVGYNMKRDIIEETLRSRFNPGVTYITDASDFDDAKKIYEELCK